MHGNPVAKHTNRLKVCPHWFPKQDTLYPEQDILLPKTTTLYPETGDFVAVSGQQSVDRPLSDCSLAP